MSDDSGESLARGLAELGLDLDDSQVAKLVEFGRLVLDHNRVTNLTGARSLEVFLTEHVLDSLSLLSVLEPLPPIIDVGSGAGLPGVPIAIARPRGQTVVLEPRAKRAEFVRGVVGRLGLSNVEVIKSSAIGPGASALRARGGTVILRAVAPPSRSLQLGASLVKPGGEIVFYEGRLAKPNKALAKQALAAGFGPWSSREVRVPGLDAKRHLWHARRSSGLGHSALDNVRRGTSQ